MTAVIVEDEQIASNRLKSLIGEVAPDVDVVATLSSVESAIVWLSNNTPPDLVFLDIQLNDGYGFDVLDKLASHPPVIFTTAYSEYAIRGFKYNGIDYLLKPIDRKELTRAIEKYRQSPYTIGVDPDYYKMHELKSLFIKEYKHRFMVKVGNRFSTFNVTDIFYFKSNESTTYLYTKEGKKYPVEYTIDQLEEILNPIDFFRINRKYMVSYKSVNEIHHYFNSRLSLKLTPLEDEKVIVSRERCTTFRKWLDL